MSESVARGKRVAAGPAWLLGRVGRERTGPAGAGKGLGRGEEERRGKGGQLMGFSPRGRGKGKRDLMFLIVIQKTGLSLHSNSEMVLHTVYFYKYKFDARVLI